MRRTVLLLLLAGCADKPAAAPRCDGGQLLVAGTCRDLCNSHTDCAGSVACVDGICGPPCTGDGDCGPVAVCGSGICVCPVGGCPSAPPPCLPNSIQCRDASLEVCDAAGRLTSTTECGAAGCNANAAPNRCNDCVPSAIGCVGGTAITCGSDGIVLAQVDCADGDACTADACLPTIGCTHVNTCPCLDPAECDDDNPCTDDDCAAGTCTNVDRTGACDDGDACTGGDSCVDGTCLAGAPVDCGANAACSSEAGEYTCTCANGTFGTSTTGAPAVCEAALVELGLAEGTISLLSVPVAQPVPVGATVVAVVVSGDGFGGSIVNDNRGNPWQTIVSNRPCGQCGESAVYWTHVVNALAAGDTIVADVSAGGSSAMWVARVHGFPFLDQFGDGDGQLTPTPTVTTTGPVTDPVELVVGGLVTERSTALVVNGSFVEVANFVGGDGSGLIAYRLDSGLVGPQALQAASASPQRFSGAIATFYGGVPLPPTNLTLAHTPNHRGFTVGWLGGRGNNGTSGCAVQVATGSGSWLSVASVNCDATTTATAANLPATSNWYGGPWSSTTARLVRVVDGAVLGSFPTALTCTPRAASTVPTPTIDEDCDGTWDDHTCTACDWASGTVYGTTFTACTNSSGVAATYACNLTAEGVRRYTNGTVPGTSPTTTWSSDSYGTACQGSYAGAVTWTCTCSGCTYY